MASVSDSSAYPSPSPNPAQLQTTYFRGMIPKQPLQGIIPSHPSLYIHRQQAHCKVYPIIHSPTLVVCETNNTTHMYSFDVLICLFFEYFLLRFKFLLFWDLCCVCLSGDYPHTREQTTQKSRQFYIQIFAALSKIWFLFQRKRKNSNFPHHRQKDLAL